MFIHKLAIVVCATGFVIQDETDVESEPFPIAGFASDQLPDALDYMRASIEIEAEGRAEDARLYKEAHDAQQAKAAQAARDLGNVVAGPGFKAPLAPAAVITHPIKTDREIVDEVNALAFTVLLQHGFSAPRGEFMFWRAEKNDVRAWRAWQQAVDLYEQITGSEVSDALHAVLEEEEEKAGWREEMRSDLNAAAVSSETYERDPDRPHQ